MIYSLDINNLNEINSKILDMDEVRNNLNSNPYSKYLIYKENDEILGYIYYSLIYDRIEINYIYVLEKERNKGIGKKLMKEVKKLNLPITLEVSMKNEYAIKLYKSMGLKEVAIRKNYYEDSDGILMEGL